MIKTFLEGATKEINSWDKHSTIKLVIIKLISMRCVLVNHLLLCKCHLLVREGQRMQSKTLRGKSYQKIYNNSKGFNLFMFCLCCIFYFEKYYYYFLLIYFLNTWILISEADRIEIFVNLSAMVQPENKRLTMWFSFFSCRPSAGVCIIVYCT